MKRIHMKPAAHGLIALAGALLILPAAQASNGVMTESVNWYDRSKGACEVPNLCNSNANAAGLRSKLSQNPGFWQILQPFQDSAVFDSDFVDPELKTNGDDGNNFDQPGSAISYVTAHGVCNAGVASQRCTSSSQCTNPPPQLGPFGKCQWAPAESTGACHYEAPRPIVVSSTSSSFGNRVFYNNAPNNFGMNNMVRFGESPNSGGWAGAGTNGGANLVVLDISCGTYRPTLSQDLLGLFGGLHMVATIMPVNGDTANVPNRGSALAQQFLANPNGSVVDAWLNVPNIIGFDGSCSQGSPLPPLPPGNPPPPGFPGAGGGGINGCGANVAFARDNAFGRFGETWSQLRDDTLDDTGGIGVSGARFFCNYDCHKFPILKD
jgi:hypothetical protein